MNRSFDVFSLFKCSVALIFFSACQPQAEKMTVRALGWDNISDSVILIDSKIPEAQYDTTGCVTIHVPKEKRSYGKTDLIKDYDFIPLETRDECLIGSIDKLIVHDGSIFILDTGSNAVFRFSQDGKYLNRFGNAGRGPGEYERITDICLDEERHEVYLVDNSGFKLLCYSYDGALVKEEPMFFQFSYLQICDGKRVECIELEGNRLVEDLAHYNVLITDANRQPLQKAFRYEVASREFVHSYKPLMKFGDRIYSRYSFNDTIWQLTDNGWRAAYTCKVDGLTFPTREELKKWTLNDAIKFFHLHGNRLPSFYSETTKFISFNANGIYWVYNKENGHIFLDSFPRIGCNEFGNELVTLAFSHVFGPDEFLASFSPQFLKDKLQSMEEYCKTLRQDFIIKPRHRELINNLKEEDNPVLMVCTLIDF